MRMKVLGAMVAILAGAGLFLIRQPSIDAKLMSLDAEMNAKLISREVHIDPAELIDLIYNFNTPLRIIDVRDEAEYNLFHIIDAQHATIDQIKDPAWVKDLPKETVFVLVSNDEKGDTQAWKLLYAQGVKNIYILAGGINVWLDLYGTASQDRPDQQLSPRPTGDDMLRHRFTFALGSKHPASDPDPGHVPKKKYVKKVKPIGRAGKKTGGCG